MREVVHERLKFIDESGVTTILTRLFGRAAPGVRVRESLPKNYGQSISVVSLIGLGGVETTMLVEGAVDTLVCNAFCENFVRPCLKVGDVSGLDSLGVHRASRIEEMRATAEQMSSGCRHIHRTFRRLNKCGRI